MNAYTNVSDEELIMRLRDGEKPIMDYIIEKYKNLVKKKTGSMYILGADRDDLLQEGMIGLFKAIRDYDSGRDASFFTFAELCITRQIYTAVQASTRKKHAFLNTYVSIYESGRNMDEEVSERNLLDVLQMDKADNANPEAIILDREAVLRIEEAIEEQLSDFEKQVLELHMTGLSVVEIAKVLDRTDKSIDNALQRLKAKIRKYR